MPYKILLVDDDAEFRFELKNALFEYDFVEAANGEEALSILRKPNEIDLVLLDVMMPGIKGTQVLKDIKDMDPDMEIVISTAYSSKDIAIEALKGRASDYIEKPLDIEKTKHTINSLLESKYGSNNINEFDIKSKIERVKNIILKNYDKKMSLEDVAKLVCISPKYLSRAFSQVAGKGFSQFKQEVRVQKSKELLKHSGKSIGQISDELGYKNLESFIRLFKKFTGTTPSAYRKQNRR